MKEEKTQSSNWVDSEALPDEEETYVIVDKQFTDPSNTNGYFLTVEEMYVYIMIRLCERSGGYTRTNIFTLQNEMDIDFYSRVTKNREKIQSTLESLREKEIIFIYGSVNFKKPNDFFYIKVRDNDIRFTNDWRGFEKIPLYIIKRAKKMEHLYMYCAIKGYGKSKLGGYMCTYEQWTDVMQMSLSSVKRLVKETCDPHDSMYSDENRLFYVNYGEYRDDIKNKQHTNLYSVVSFEEKDKTSATLRKEAKSKGSKKIVVEEDNPF